MTVKTVISLLFVAFSINLIYEILHSLLYKTCLEMSIKKYVPLIIKASLVDAVWITGFYFITYAIFKNENPLTNYLQTLLFLAISISFAYGWEIYSIKNNRWKYSKAMPLVLGAGLTPLVQLFLTGITSFWLVFHFLQ